MHGIPCIVSRIEDLGRRHRRGVQALGVSQGGGGRDSFWLPTSTGDSVAGSLHWHRCQVPCLGMTDKVRWALWPDSGVVPWVLHSGG